MIETITLKQMEIVETESGYEKRFLNEQNFPAAITNYSLSMGEKLELIESSTINDLTDVEGLFQAAIDPNADKEKALKNMNTGKYLKVIYLAIIGINKDLNLTYEEFTQLYHEDQATIIDTYTKLILATMQ